MSFEKIRAHFPVANHSLYANTAAIGLLSDDLLEWRQEHDLDFLIGGSQMKMESFQMISDAKETVGQFLGCKRDRVALVPNFSLALNMVLEGMPKEYRVLLLQTDYPSVNWPFESRGFPISYAKLDEDLEEHIEAKLSVGNIQVFAFSLVQWQNGIKIDLNFIKQLREKYPELLMIADGTQFCGAFNIDFDSSGLDMLGASGYKWLLAGTGNGFMLFSERTSDHLSLKTTGFNAVNGQLDSTGPIRLAKHLEPGHLDSLCFGSLQFSIKKLMEWNMEKIEAHNRGLIRKAMDAFGNLGLLSDAIRNRKDHGTILNIRGDDALYAYLEEENVSCSQRGGGIRLSFHLYNTEEEIDAIVKILKSAP
jgi:selenocysteine lyase/cysteine desulfurase